MKARKKSPVRLERESAQVLAECPAEAAEAITRAGQKEGEAVKRSYVAAPRCLHGEPWKTCGTCTRQTWCEDCGDRIELEEPPHPRETVTCAKCVDRMIGKAVA